MGGANRELTDKELSGGIVADGIGASIASIFGILPTTSFSQNTGIITMTKVMSRYVVGLGAVILMIGAFFPKVDRKSTRLNSSHANISYAVFCLKKKYPHATLFC